MKKFLLVVFIGLTLVINIYAQIEDFVNDVTSFEEVIDRNVTIVYTE